MQDSWQTAIDGFWNQVDGKTEGELQSELGALLTAQVPTANALFERASLHDYLGEEATAVGLYQQAMASGLEGPKRSEAMIQLGSSLRNIGHAHQAVQLLKQIELEDPLYLDAQGFLALALLDAGHPESAVASALRALAPAMKIYSRPVQRYAQELDKRD